MDSRIGLDYIVENRDYTTKLGAALDTNNAQVKKQVFELLSALCVYSADGYNRALEALEHYKTFKSERYRFKLVVDELRTAKTDDYRTVLLAFVNCLIISTPQLKDRNNLRNEFIGLKLTDVLKTFREKSKGRNPKAEADSDLQVQLDVFEEQKESDETHSEGPHGVDLTSHLDVFYSIYNTVMDTPQEIPFLNILQHLLRVDPKEPVSDVIWDTAERLVHRATLLENKEDSQRLLRAPSLHKGLHRLKSEVGLRKQSLEQQGAAAPPPPPPPPGGGAAPPPPPPPPGGGPPPPPPPPGGGPPPPPPPPGAGPPPPPPPPPPGGGPPPPPPPPGGGPPPPPPPGGPGAPPPPPPQQQVKLPQLETPKPKQKMRTFNWNKLPVNKILGKKNIWSLVAKKNEEKAATSSGKTKGKTAKQPINFEDMEHLFCQQAAPQPSSSSAGGGGKDEADKSKKKDEVNLLDGKRSLNINIFLKQFRSSNEDIIQMVLEGEYDDFGSEKLKGLVKILPEMDEIEMLKSFDGDRSKLGNAEKFILQLVEVPNYRLRIESMLLRAEFEANMGFLEPSIDSMLAAGEELTSNQKLQDLFYMVLMAGNFLNSGGYAGNAAGMKISSLHKLSDIRSNKPGMNLLHYVALQAEESNPDLLSLPEDLAILEEASKTPLEQLRGDINKLDAQISKIQTQLKNPNTKEDIKRQMNEFLPKASRELDSVKEGMEELVKSESEIAEFFCEDATSFKLEECFKSLWGFCVKFRKSVTDNAARREAEAMAAQRRAQREAEDKNKRPGAAQKDDGKGEDEEDEEVVKNLMSDIHSGFVQRRLPDGGFKQQYSPMVMRKFRRSLDNGEQQTNGNSNMGSEESLLQAAQTPSGLNSPRPLRKFRAGSLSGDLNDVGSPASRRRRSRIPSEENDDQLINFLTAGGGAADGGMSRERNLSAGNLAPAEGSPYGSLDRGLMRRSRGRKKPSEQFTEDRDRQPMAIKPEVSDSKESTPAPPSETEGAKFKNRIKTWQKDFEDDASHAAKYLEGKRKKKEEIAAGKGLGKSLVDKTDVLKAMEAVEETSARKKTPPSRDNDRKKQLIRELGRRPSQEKVSLYVKKDKEGDDGANKAKAFMDKMSRKAVDADFLNTIKEEEERRKPFQAKKYPFNRTTTPNSLREHLKETLVKNLNTGSSDLSDTIQSIKDDEIQDTFDVDNENVETPPMARRAARHRSFRLPLSNVNQPSQEDDDDQRTNHVRSGSISDLSSRRRSKFKSVGADGGSKPLGDRELMLKKNRASSSFDLGGDEEDDLGDGVFDRYSSARRSLMRSKNDEDTRSLAADLGGGSGNERKKSDWRSRLASKFKRPGEQYSFGENDDDGNVVTSSYRKTSDELPVAPMTEPTRRRTTIAMSNNNKGGVTSRTGAARPSQISGRKSSYGDYDSELVDGRYVTSVPILSPDDEDEMHRKLPGASSGSISSRGNLRSEGSRGLRELKKTNSNSGSNPSLNRKSSIMDRLSSGTMGSTRRATTNSNNVFDRLSGSRKALNEDDPYESKQQRGGTLNKLKDLTKTLRKGSREEEGSSSVVTPRDSTKMFDASNGRRATHSGLGNGSAVAAVRRSDVGGSSASPRTARRATASITPSRTVSSRALGPSSSMRSPANSTGNLSSRRVGPTNSIDNTKENLSRSSSSSNSVSAHDVSRLTANGNGAVKTSTATLRMSNSNPRVGGAATARVGPNSSSSSMAKRGNNASSTLSFMKPTTSSAKKLSATPSDAAARSPARGKMSTPIISARNTRR